MSAVALPWYVLTTTGSPARMAVVLVAETLPFALFGVPAGALVDRMDLKRVLVGLDVGRAFVIGLIPILAWMDLLQFWMIVVLAFLGGLLTAPYQGARLAVIPAVVGEEESDMASANTLLQSAFYATSIAGPVLAGFLIPLVGNGTVIFLDALSYGVAALLIGLGMSYSRVERTTTEEPHLFREMREGIRYALDDAQVRLVMVLGALAGLGFWLILDAALPVFTRDVLSEGPEELGLLAKRLATTEDATEAAQLRERLTRGFYGI
jgi:MFS family permease